MIASKVHKLQGFENYTDYKLIKINGRSYDYGCFSKFFTSNELELVSAYEVVCSEKKQNDISSFEHFINVSAKYGMDKEVLRHYLDYTISFYQEETDILVMLPFYGMRKRYSL